MTLTHHTGNLFDSQAPALGHGVNTKGSMGAGIAAQFAQRYPYMYQAYKRRCDNNLFTPGTNWMYLARQESYEPLNGWRWIANIASQEYPGPGATISHLTHALLDALQDAEDLNLHTLAIPRIGSGIGGLNEQDALEVFEVLANGSPVNLELWTYAPPTPST